MKRCLKDFILIFILAFIVSALVSFLYSIIVHGKGVIDWGSSIRLGIILGILLPRVNSKSRKKVQD